MKPLFLMTVPVVLAGCIACDDGRPPPEPEGDPGCALVAGLSLDECDAVRSFALPEALPESPGNAFADDEDAAYLGFKIFYDARFSSNVNVRCASCHLPEKAFIDAEPTSVDGVGDVGRNSPTTLNAAHHTTFFWGGRADSLWSQPLFAIEAENEMDFTRLQTAHTLARLYRGDYEAVFGTLPALDEGERFPPTGKPGDAAWESMAEADKDAINRVFANIGKSLEAFMRRATGTGTRLDEFLDGEADALSADEVDGLRVFVEVGCIACHSGPLLSDEKFHNIGLVEPGEPDLGRAVEATVVLDNEFSLFGAYADANDVVLPSASDLEAESGAESSLGAFRTPSLRHISRTAPYGHHGRIATLDEIVDLHLGASITPAVGVLSPLLRPATLSDADRVSLLAFLRSLDVDYPLPPWNDWPER